jgi:hypothetical protein
VGRFEFIEREGFSVAFLAALAASAVIAVVALAYQRWRGPGRVLPIAGLISTGAAVLALRQSHALLGDADDLYIGLAALAAGGLVAALPRIPWFVRLPLLLPGAVLLSDAAASATEPQISGNWVRALAFVVVLVGGTTIIGFDRRYAQAGLGPVALAATATGVYLCVPDTEQALPLVGAFLAVGLLGWPKPLASLGSAGACAAVGLIVWTAAAGGRGRAGSIVGGMACLGIVLLEPPVRSLLRARARPAPRKPWVRDALVIAGLHFGVVIVCSRIAGLRSSAEIAAIIAGLTFAGACVALWRALRPPTEARREVSASP